MDLKESDFSLLSGEGVTVTSTYVKPKLKSPLELVCENNLARSNVEIPECDEEEYEPAELPTVQEQDRWFAYMLIKYCGIAVDGVYHVKDVNEYERSMVDIHNFSNKYSCISQGEVANVTIGDMNILVSGNNFHKLLGTRSAVSRFSLYMNGVSAVRMLIDDVPILSITISTKSSVKHYWSNADYTEMIEAPCDGGGNVTKYKGTYIVSCDCEASYEFGARTNNWCEPEDFCLTPYNRIPLIGLQVMLGMVVYNVYLHKDYSEIIECFDRMDGLDKDAYEKYTGGIFIDTDADIKLIKLLCVPNDNTNNYISLSTNNKKFDSVLSVSPDKLDHRNGLDINMVVRDIIESLQDGDDPNMALVWLRDVGHYVNVHQFRAYLRSLGFYFLGSIKRPKLYINYIQYSKYLSHKGIVDRNRFLLAAGVTLPSSVERVGATIKSPKYVPSKRGSRSVHCRMTRQGIITDHRISFAKKLEDAIVYSSSLSGNDRIRHMSGLSRFAQLSEYDPAVLAILDKYDIAYFSKLEYELELKKLEQIKVNRAKRNKKRRMKMRNPSKTKKDKG